MAHFHIFFVFVVLFTTDLRKRWEQFSTEQPGPHRVSGTKTSLTNSEVGKDAGDELGVREPGCFVSKNVWFLSL